ncbi:MAG: microcompartment protein [Kineosporiaceae bacterium]|nr:microcompartment protein [Kineosporiaceae bacterium]MBK7625442.1 microcompartment protein [Kineosporiaceae bacterium]MBK8076195.1 microcompartment protein [Kineosporiaceae bacterium]
MTVSASASASAPVPVPAPQLRVYLVLEDLQPQFAAYLGTPTRARGYPPYAGQHALIVEVAPGLAIERVTSLALHAMPSLEVGLLFVERQFGILEVHADSADDVRAAGEAILAGIGASPADQLRPQLLYHDVIEDVQDQHAVIVNRTRQASMLLPGQSLLVVEVTPALFAAMAVNEAEKVAPEATLVDVSMIGAAGRVYLSGDTATVQRAREAIVAALGAVAGRDH